MDLLACRRTCYSLRPEKATNFSRSYRIRSVVSLPCVLCRCQLHGSESSIVDEEIVQVLNLHYNLGNNSKCCPSTNEWSNARVRETLFIYRSVLAL